MTREEAIKMLKSKMDGHTDTSYEWCECVRMAIEALEQTRWIPVSERLPEKNDVYLVAVEAFGYPRRDVDGFIGQTPRKWEHYGNKVVAWMPLPKPYKAEREVSE